VCVCMSVCVCERERESVCEREEESKRMCDGGRGPHHALPAAVISIYVYRYIYREHLYIGNIYIWVCVIRIHIYRYVCK